MKTVRVEPEAKEELAAAALWYEQRREGLGRELLAEVDAVLAAIAFIELPTVVRVLAVAHERRRPGYCVGRAKAR